MRRRGSPRGRSNARAAFMRKRAPKRDELPISSSTLRCASSGVKLRMTSSGSGLARGGRRSMMPSSVVWTCTSKSGPDCPGISVRFPRCARDEIPPPLPSPSHSLTRLARAIPHGAFTLPPKGEWMTTRVESDSSRNCSTTSCLSSGTTPVAPRCSRTKFTTDRIVATSHSYRFASAAMFWGVSATTAARRSSPMRVAMCGARDMYSPCQKGIRAGAPGAGRTMTRSCSIACTFQVDEPS